MMYGRPNHTLITTMERAEGADEGPERSQARTKQRKPSQKVILVCLQHERLSTEVSRDTSRDMAGEVGRDPLLHRYPYPDIPVPEKDGSGFFRVRVTGLTGLTGVSTLHRLNNYIIQIALHK